MDHDDDATECNSAYAIPAASIADVDLSSLFERDPAAAAEISRIGDALGQGTETTEEFLQLCVLLNEHGFERKAEHLLRRNLDEGDESHALYLKLFGTRAQDTFTRAISDFRRRFEVTMRFVESHGFLDSAFLVEPTPREHTVLPILEEQCEVRIDFADEDAVTVDVSSLESGSYVALKFLNEKWYLSEQSDSNDA